MKSSMPRIVATSPQDIADQPIEDRTDVIYSFLDADALTEHFTSTDHVFTDADGTVVMEGTVVLAAEYVEAITALAQAGVGVTIVTGKPLAEVSRLIDSIPAGTPLQFLCEKGAYTVSVGADGSHEKHFVLSSDEHEVAVTELRKAFFEHEAAKIIDATRAEDGSQRVWFGLSGSGEHKSIFSVDINGSEMPENYLDLVGAEREALKLHDESLLKQVEALLEAWVLETQPDWRVVHLGNGNTDIAPGPIEKDAAIIRTPEFEAARTVQVWGDTMNDQAMFRLRDEYPEKVIAGLVLHREKSKPLLPDVDMVTYGMANAAPFFGALLATHDD